MTEKDLKKLSRKELLELLLEQTRRVNYLQEKLAAAERQLANRSITASEAGSIAEAALKLNGVFEAAEAAASQYIVNVKRMSEKQGAPVPVNRQEPVWEDTPRPSPLSPEMMARIDAKLNEFFDQGEEDGDQ
ncbi:MAG: DNA repair protein [Clostridia bacterium]|nr:DNA repair protein [Clostridia bacterium]MBQ8893219.1 DNA repair protein [Clostridia bacterium]